ncbi:MAG: hypothetical protein KA146_02085 [Leptospiraceae bacterium]|nr:hypothetical protein [Leptospiraceae bacterium]
MKRIITFITLVVILFSIGCKKEKKDDKSILGLFALVSTANSKKITLSIKGMGSSTVSNQQLSIFRSVSSPIDPEYPGMGVHGGNTVVDGLKIKLTKINLIPVGSGSGGGGLFDWTTSPKELEVSKGFNGAITDTGILANGEYSGLSIGISPNYSIKAWAYLDTNNDGTVDTTVWTTASGIQKVASKLASTSAMANYDYYKYSFLYVSSATSATNDTAIVGEFTYFTNTLTVTDAPKTKSKDSDGNEIEIDTPSSYSIDIRLDTFQLPKVWDGVPDTRLEPFSSGNNNGIPTSSFFPDNQPNFALQYLALFGFYNQQNSVSETYAFSNSNSFLTGSTQLFTIVFDNAGNPLAGRVRDRGGLDLNQFPALYKKEASGTTWSFGIGDAAVLYNQDTNAVQKNISGFKRLNIGDAAVQITVTDGPACASSSNACPGTKTGFIKRLQRND